MNKSDINTIMPPYIVYISGKITGLDIMVARKNFDYAHKILEDNGYNAINPFYFKCTESRLPWIECMEYGLPHLLSADFLCLLSNWEDSIGARIEYTIHRSLGEKVMTIHGNYIDILT